MIRLFTALLTLMLIFMVALTFKRTIDKVLNYMAILLPTVSLLFIAATLNDILDGSATHATWMVFVLSLVGTATGLKLLFDAWRCKHKSTQKYAEKHLLEIVRQHAGRVTPIDIAMQTDYTVEEAEQKLDLFCEQNIAERDLTPSGKIVYVFPGFMSEAEKRQAQDPMTL